MAETTHDVSEFSILFLHSKSLLKLKMVHSLWIRLKQCPKWCLKKSQGQCKIQEVGGALDKALFFLFVCDENHAIKVGGQVEEMVHTRFVGRGMNFKWMGCGANSEALQAVTTHTV